MDEFDTFVGIGTVTDKIAEAPDGFVRFRNIENRFERAEICMDIRDDEYAHEQIVARRCG